MNVGHPSNLARLVDAYGGWMTETGELKKAPDMEAMRRDLYSVSISDEETRATIKKPMKSIASSSSRTVRWAGPASSTSSRTTRKAKTS